jgi:hypothetical protein
MMRYFPELSIRSNTYMHYGNFCGARYVVLRIVALPEAA